MLADPGDEREDAGVGEAAAGLGAGEELGQQIAGSVGRVGECACAGLDFCVLGVGADVVAGVLLVVEELKAGLGGCCGDGRGEGAFEGGGVAAERAGERGDRGQQAFL